MNKELHRLEKLGLIKHWVDIKSGNYPYPSTYSLTFDALKDPDIARPFLFASSVSNSFYYGQTKRSLVKPPIEQASPWLSLSRTAPETFLHELAHKIGSYVLFMYLKDLEDFMDRRAKEGERGVPVADLAKLEKATKGLKPGELKNLSKENIQVTEGPGVLDQYVANPESGEFDLTRSPLSEKTRVMLRDFDENFITTMGVHSLLSYLHSKGTALKLSDLVKAFDSTFAKESKVLSEVWQSPAQIIDYETGKKAYSSLVPSSKKGEALWPD
ncbi:MAG: hypothetical protein JRM71_05745 [Nitrososphaerota archaeon]|nr:hypothetical protein [Nitrososphaerota archaeon]